MALNRTLSSVLFGVACMALPLAAADEPPQPTLSDEERAQVLELFDQSTDLYLGLLAGVSDRQWSFKPAPDRWSVGECAEHIMRSNELLYGSAKAALANAADPEWHEKTKGKSELLLAVMPNRNPGGAGGASAPQEIRPTGEFTRTEIVRRFKELHERARAYVAETEEPLKQHLEQHPFPVFNPLNAYDWILYVPLHTIRHCKQMIEVMETEGYPES